MQARFATLSAIALVLAAATPAFADPTLEELLAAGACPELPICGHCGADDNQDRDVATDPTATAHGGAEAAQDVFVTEATAAEGSTAYVGSANGGVWRSTDSAASAIPSDVTTAPAEGRTDYLLELGGVEGDSGAPPAQTAQDVNSGQTEQAGLLLPAIQPPRRDGSLAADPGMDGVVVLTDGLPQEGRTGTGTLTLSNGSAPAETDGLMIIRASLPAAETPNDPEMPVCGHCGTDVQVQATAEQAAEPQQETEQERPRRRFSITVAGVTLSSDGGVNIAVGDVNGDGRESSREQSSAPPARSSRGR